MTCVGGCGNNRGGETCFFNRESGTYLRECGNILGMAEDFIYTLEFWGKAVKFIGDKVPMFDFFSNNFRQARKFLHFVTVGVSIEITYLNVYELCLFCIVVASQSSCKIE